MCSLFISLLLGHDDHKDDGTRCGTEQYMEEQFALDPTYKERLEKFEEYWKKHEEDIKSGKIKPISKTSVNQVVIPVVYHVLYNTQSQNVPDSVIAYQNQVLNDDFAGTNSDYNYVPIEFQPLRANDMGIRYFVQDTIRRQTSVTSFSTNNNIKFTNQGGSDVVEPNRFLNFWCGALSGGLLGYAQFPGGNPNTDGVVNAYFSLSPDAGPGPYNLGRTATHEIGHWLNLRHIWGDTSNCITNDFVDDTPPSNAPNYGCNKPNSPPIGPGTFPKRCTQNPYSQDMGVNYMDYSEDACLIMFTNGQSERAWQSIYQYRQGFNPTLAKYSNQLFIYNIYFIEYDHEILDDNKKCFGGIKELFYSNNINEGSQSNKYIYGCKQMTTNLNAKYIQDIKFIAIDNEKDINYDSVKCDDGYYKATQNLNIGNNNIQSMYMCIKYGRFSLDELSNIEKFEAVVDVTFIRDNNRLNMNEKEWIININDNINKNGISLNLAFKKIEINVDKDSTPYFSSVMNQNSTTEKYIYIGIAVGCIGIIVMIMSAVLYFKYCRNNQKNIKTKDVLSNIIESDSLNAYGSHEMEMAKIDVK